MTMTRIQRYAVTLPGTPGTHAPPSVVTVHLTEETAVDGQPVYANTSGSFRVRITDDGVAQPLGGVEAGCDQSQCLHAVPLP